MRQTPAAQAIYQQRKVIIEPVFGEVKIAVSGYSADGAKKAPGKFSKICAAHNFKKTPSPFRRD
jgi:hypothetical protein